MISKINLKINLIILKMKLKIYQMILTKNRSKPIQIKIIQINHKI